MNLSEIGLFIANCRKKKGLTQEKLAQKLFISEKTVSKWECGKGFPDSSLILPLCQVLDISANELLSGKSLTDVTYKESAEQNLIKLKSLQESSWRYLLILEIVIGYMATTLFLLSIFSASYFVDVLAWRVVLIVFGFLNLFVALGFCLHIERNAGFYECRYCHGKFIPSYSAVLWSMHCSRTRYMKCPHCHKRSWCKKTTSGE